MSRPRGAALAGAAAATALVALAAAVACSLAAPDQVLTGHVLEDALLAVLWAAVAVCFADGRRGRHLPAVALLVCASATAALLGTAAVVAGPAPWGDVGELGGRWTWVPAAVLPSALVPLLVVRPGRLVRGGAVLALAGTAAACAALAVGGGGASAATGSGPAATAVLVASACLVAALGVGVVVGLREVGRGGPGRRRGLVVGAAVASAAALATSAAVPAVGPLAQVLAAPLVPLALVALLVQDLLDAVRASHARLAAAREEERERLAGDLHDDVGPLLSALGAHADTALLRLRAGRPGVEELLERVRALDDAAICATRRVLADLSPGAAGHRPLVTALAELATEPGGPGPRVRVDADDPGSLPPPVVAAVTRIAAEAVTNAVRHAAATEVAVVLRCRSTGAGPALVLEVRDDGTGVATAPGPPGSGRGLPSMARRAEVLGGRLRLTSSPGGTRVVAEVPVAP